MDQHILDYSTHCLSLKAIDSTDFVKATNLVKNVIYKEMLNAYLSKYEVDFISEERIILNNFVKSLTAFHNKTEHMVKFAPEMHTFADDVEYYTFCIFNNLPHDDQEWFKTIYIKATLLYSITLFISASVAFLKTLYPEHYSKPIDLFEQVLQNYQKKKNKYKCDPNEHKDFLLRNNISRLYHFSNRKNLESIKSHGLCSILEVTKLGIYVNYSSSEGSRAIDLSKQLIEYVHLSYERHTPMLYIALAEGRLYEYLILEIDPEVIFHKETKFSDINAASNGAVISSDINFFLNLPFSSFHDKRYYRLSEQSKKKYQAEVLVNKNIKTNLVLNINEL